MLLAGSRRRFLRQHLPSFALLAGSAPGVLLAAPTLGDSHGRPDRPLSGPTGDADLVLVDNWILRRSDLEHLG